jgi:hypothetical protein
MSFIRWLAVVGVAVVLGALGCEEGPKYHPKDGGAAGGPAGIAGVKGGRGGDVGVGGQPVGASGGVGGSIVSTGGAGIAGETGSGGQLGDAGTYDATPDAGADMASSGGMGAGGRAGTGGASNGGSGPGGRVGTGGVSTGGTGSGGRAGTGGAGTGGAAGRPGSGGIVGTGGAGTGGAMSTCQPGATQCAVDELQTCGANGQWGAASTCGAHRVCTGSAGTAKCTCTADPICKAVGSTCSGTNMFANCAVDGNGCFYQASSMMCAASQTCNAGQCTCNAGLTLCNGACVDLKSDPKNCGACGAATCFDNGMGCSAAGQCTCLDITPNGRICSRPGDVSGVCWSGKCVLPASAQGCTADTDCVPGGCTGSGGFCIGTTRVAGQVSCSDNNGFNVVCNASDGCSYTINARPSPVNCGNNAAPGNVTCDGPNDCPTGSDCCGWPGGALHCAARKTDQPDVIGSGCPSIGGTQTGTLCDPLTPSCPGSMTCVGRYLAYFGCQ